MATSHFKLPVWLAIESYQAALALTEVFVFERLRDLGWNPDSLIPVLPGMPVLQKAGF